MLCCSSNSGLTYPGFLKQVIKYKIKFIITIELNLIILKCINYHDIH